MLHRSFTICLLLLLLTPVKAYALKTVTAALANESVQQRGTTVNSESATSPKVPSGQGQNSLSEEEPSRSFLSGNDQSTLGQSFTGNPAWVRYDNAELGAYPPFGANLFQGYFKSTYYDGVNPNYMVSPGDRIGVQLWGAQNYTDTVMVDQQGNIFLPEVGPLHVGGLRNANLQSYVKQQIASTFKSNVEIYVNLLSSQPSAVYVTGFVKHPGRYAGGLSDSVLYYLDKAGGIIPERGSYRDITIRRGNRNIAKVDLYSFILNGKLPIHNLRGGDVIVVAKKGDSVIADGLIPQYATYEGMGKVFLGKELIELATPIPAASHVSVSGIRNAKPFHIYSTLRKFKDFNLSAGDKVEFLADQPGESILVSVSGATTSQTRFPVKRTATLRNLLAHISIDPQISNTAGIYIKRKSVASQQHIAIVDAVNRMENSILTASSATHEGAAIRAQEAQLIENFAERVGAVKPNGVVVVTRNGQTADILLEDGDEVVIPQRSDVVMISGEVTMPKAVVYSKKYSLSSYIKDAGGYTDRADKSNILLMRPNGEVVSASSSTLAAGDMILVLPVYDSKEFTLFKDITQIIYQVAIAAGVLISL